jgi:hypothetical protein
MIKLNNNYKLGLTGRELIYSSICHKFSSNILIESENVVEHIIVNLRKKIQDNIDKCV